MATLSRYMATLSRNEYDTFIVFTDQNTYASLPSGSFIRESA